MELIKTIVGGGIKTQNQSKKLNSRPTNRYIADFLIKVQRRDYAYRKA